MIEVKLVIAFGLYYLFSILQAHSLSSNAGSPIASKIHSCAIGIAKLYFNQKSPIEVIISNHYDTNVMEYVFKGKVFSVYLRELNLQSRRKQSVDNYIVAVSNFREIELLADMEVQEFWNPHGRFIIILHEGMNVLDAAFNALLGGRIINVVILTTDVEKNIVNAYSYFPYANGSCGKEPTKAVLLANCDSEEIKNVSLFPDKIENNFAGCTINVATHIFSPYAIYAPDSDNNSIKLAGIEATALEELAFTEKIKINYTIIKSKPNFGVVGSGKNATGLMAYLRNGQADIVFGGYVLSNDRIALFDYLSADLRDTMVIIVPRATPVEQWKNIFFTFRYEVLLICLIIYISCSLLLYASNRVSSMKCNTFTCLVNTFLICWGVFFFNAMRAVNVDNKKLRFIFLMWLGYCGFLNACYQSTLFSILARTIYNSQIDSFEALMQSNLKLAVNTNEWKRMIINQDPMVEAIRDRVTLVPTLADSLLLLTRDKTHFVISDISNYRADQAAFTADDGHLLTHYLNVKHNDLDIAMYTVKGFPHRDRFQKRLIRYCAIGMFEKLKRDLYAVEKPQLPSTHMPLTMAHLSGSFYLLFIGVSISFIAFLWEVFQNYCIKRKKNCGNGTVR